MLTTSIFMIVVAIVAHATGTIPMSTSLILSILATLSGLGGAIKEITNDPIFNSSTVSCTNSFRTEDGEADKDAATSYEAHPKMDPKDN